MRDGKRKRYVLIQADGKLPPAELEALAKMLEQRHGATKLTMIEGAVTSLIAKTDVAGAHGIRDSLGDATFGKTRVKSVLTSGSIGKLKRRAQGSSAREDVQVLQR